ncbi:MAG: 12,18-didecarboxysiroheme deacetylase [Victivallales bacterium]|jgi:12,18-didecarboxysiroheme deacetylase
MIGISKLYMGQVEASDALRYGRSSARLPSHLLQFSSDKKPVVIWNVTKKCNLSCRHCYAATSESSEPELTFEEGKKLIDDLSAFGCPVILFSGGEPLIRPDLPELADYAVSKGLRAVISTNGTLIDQKVAEKLKKIGLSYVGISLDGLRDIHDRFRGRQGAFDDAMKGIRACKNAGLKVGLRFTVCRENVGEIPGIFKLLRDEGIPRICIYHLVYTGRGAEIAQGDLDHKEARTLMDTIVEETGKLYASGLKTEVLTVDNHSDGPYLYKKMLREGNPRASKVLDLLRMNAGNSSGLGVACVSWDGKVYPDQFWRNKILGNVRDKSFGEIWTDPKNSFLMKLKEKKRYVTGRCASCCFLDVCGGNFRARAEAATGDIWAPDPACYLSDEEIQVGNLESA